MTTVTIPEAIDYMCAFLAPDVPFIKAGPPGIGKTEAAEQTASRLVLADYLARCNVAPRPEWDHVAFAATHPITSEPTDYRGIPQVVSGLAEWLPIGLMQRLVDPACPPTVCLIDDIGQCQDDVQAAVMHIMLARQVGDYPIAPTVSFVACTNGTEHGAGARSLLSPLVTRGVLLNVVPDNQAFARHVIHTPDCHPLVAAYAMSRADLFASDYERDGKQICTPRGLMKLGKLMHRTGNESLPTAIVAGAIGGDRGEDMTLFVMESAGNAGLLDNHAMLENAIKLRAHGVMSYVVSMAAYRTVAGEDMSRVTQLLKGDWRECYDTLIGA